MVGNVAAKHADLHFSLTSAAAVQIAAQSVQLRQNLMEVFHKMPQDLQQTMLSSPHRAALLQLSGPPSKVSSKCDSHLQHCILVRVPEVLLASTDCLHVPKHLIHHCKCPKQLASIQVCKSNKLSHAGTWAASASSLSVNQLWFQLVGRDNSNPALALA